MSKHTKTRDYVTFWDIDQAIRLHAMRYQNMPTRLENYLQADIAKTVEAYADDWELHSDVSWKLVRDEILAIDFYYFNVIWERYARYYEFLLHYYLAPPTAPEALNL